MKKPITGLREGMRVKALRPSKEYKRGATGVIEGIGLVWDRPDLKEHVGVRMDDGKYVMHPVELANYIWEPV